MKKVGSIIFALIISYFTAYPVGHWFASKYKGGSGEFFIGSFPGYLDGFLFSYVFFAAILASLGFGKLRNGFYAALPVVAFDLLHPSDPQLWMDIVLLAAGLGLAYLILKLKSKT